MDWSSTHPVSYALIIFLPVTLCGERTCSLEKQWVANGYQYYQKGDVIIGGLISAHFSSIDISTIQNAPPILLCLEFHMEQYKSTLMFMLTIDEINKNPELLPNVTLGYHIFDTCGSSRKSIKSAIQILSGKDKETPNYSNHGKVAAFVLNSGFHANMALIQFLSLYKFTQISYGPFDPLLSNRVLYPTLYQISPDDWARYTAIVKCLQYFGWTWVGIFTQQNGIGEMEADALSKLMIQHKICVDFIIKFSQKDAMGNLKKTDMLAKSNVKVIVLCGPYHYYLNFFSHISASQLRDITLIIHESWTGTKCYSYGFCQFFNCSLTVMMPRVPKHKYDMKSVNPSTRPNDPMLEDLWYENYYCLTRNKDIFLGMTNRSIMPSVNCTKIHDLTDMINDDYKDTYMYYAYTAVYILAHVLNRTFLRRTSSWTNGLRQKVSRLMGDIVNIDKSGKSIYFNEERKVRSAWRLANNMVWYGTKFPIINATIVGTFEDSEQEEKKPNIDLGKIIWKNNKMPHSRCNDPCSPGYRKAPKRGYHVCCYDCVPCSEGEMSNKTDSEICHKCPKEEWPDEKKVKCVPRIYEFLSYKDLISLIFLGLVLFFSSITLFTLGTFIYYWDSTIVKANNRIVSLILLVSILLGFLSVFFFLGRPVDITCLLRQISFGIFFSIGVSCVLAKTITVCIAFKASKPGSIWRKCLTVNVSYYVVFICSSIQVLICVIWLLVSPPYVDFDHRSYPGKIIIQCNEGSVLAFYLMLGYMGFLAAVSFVLAFMVRTLPDIYNEAKYITFSMLVFCSVWMTMIPVYLSIRGKYMVVVEIFAILTSCAGILDCIFLPKMHIILLKPNLNLRKTIIGKNKI